MSHLKLLQDAVAAKLRYWDANRALEKALCEDDISDKDADTIEDMISMLASGLDGVEDSYQCVMQINLDELKRKLK
jgi:hypothetical protein